MLPRWPRENRWFHLALLALSCQEADLNVDVASRPRSFSLSAFGTPVDRTESNGTLSMTVTVEVLGRHLV
jgi:hypothetical protein